MPRRVIFVLLSLLLRELCSPEAQWCYLTARALCPHDFKLWFGQLIPRVEQMQLHKSYATKHMAVWRQYFESGFSPREALRRELCRTEKRLPQVHRSSA